ncbi:MAG: DMT family transporter [Alphaproteobacteria bacterium]|nr:DMT family transporter [Alphaproteobacteria bacterium]
MSGPVLMLLALAIFASTDAMIKALTEVHGPYQILLIKAAISLGPLLAIAAASGFATLRTAHLGFHLLRGGLITGAFVLITYSFSVLPLAEAYVVSYTSPLISAVLARFFLGEALSPRILGAILLGFAGVATMAAPDLSGARPLGLAAAAAGSVLWAANVVAVRRLGRTESNTALLFYSSLVSIVVMLPLMPGRWVDPDPAGWLLLTAMSLFATVGGYCVVEAFKRAEVARLVPLEYTAMLWALGFDYAFWGTLPIAWTLVGAVLVIGAALIAERTRPAAIDSPRGGG